MTIAEATQNQTSVSMPHDSNQAIGIGQFAVQFMSGKVGGPDQSVLDRTIQFHTDSVLCGISALALGTNAPTVLRDEAFEYERPAGVGVPVFGSTKTVAPEKAILANSSAVREWDSNGTNFGYNPNLGSGHTAGEFGHNDYYPVAIAAAQLANKNGAYALRGMVCLDEIRGRLAEVFSLKTYKIDHVVHGAIASAATYGAMLGATPEQIESAIGMFIAHYIPWRAIRAGKQLSDSKGASAAISTEAAIICMQRSMRGFIGPKDIFRNPEAIFRQFIKTKGESPFDLVLSHTGDDFAVMGMHFKIGLYEHQSAGAIQGLIDLIQKNSQLLSAGVGGIKSIKIIAYEPAFGIIGDPAKRDPQTRQSADHSMVYIIATLLRKAFESILPPPERGRAGEGVGDKKSDKSTHPLTPSLKGGGNENDSIWKSLMLVPDDYSHNAIFNKHTRAIMEKISFEHGGPEYDKKYPDGIPTSIIITTNNGKTYDSGLIMYPAGHARNTTADLNDLLATKFERLGSLASSNSTSIIDRFNNLPNLTSRELQTLYDFQIAARERIE